MSSDLCKILPTNYSFTNHIYLIYLYKQDLALNNYKSRYAKKFKQLNRKLLTWHL